MRKISKTLALMSCLAPLGANALGIGEIRLHSALNQALNAEIPLVTSPDEEISDIRVSLASPDAFSRAGIERNYLLTRLRFAPLRKPDGSYVVKVSSREAIREPFLNFMIDVYWPQGRVQREFTVLLDPPASFPENTVADVDIPETEREERTYQPVAPSPRPLAPVQERPRRIVRESRANMLPPVARSEIPISGTRYGPVNKNETLWSIAKRLNTDPSLSQEQMLVALYKANPRAFYRNSMDALRAGETLVIPDRTTIAALTGTAIPAHAPRNAGRLTPRPQSRPEEDAGESTRGQLKLLAPSEDKSAGEKAKSGKSREDIALEVADTAKQESEEIRSRLADLEQKLSGMQRLLSLKDEQIANLQAQQKQPAAESLQPQPAPAEAPGMRQAPGATAPGMEPYPQASAVAPQQPRIQPPPVPRPSATTSAVPRDQPPVSPLVRERPSPQPAVNFPTNAEEGFLAGLLQSPASLMAAGSSILLMLAGASWLITRRREAMISESESILSVGNKEQLRQAKKTSSLYDHTLSSLSDHTSSVVRSSFLSEFTPSDFEALGGEMEDVDPISEADVYLAYGRYKQAEELIRNAIAQNPERDDCKLKLLEIHYSTENVQAFEKFAEELARTHREAHPDFWEKVTEMGLELCPGNSLFMEQKAAYRPQPHVSPEETKADEKTSFIPPLRKIDEAHGNPLPTPREIPERSSPDGSPATLAYDFFSTEAKQPSEAGNKFDNVLEPLDFSRAISPESRQSIDAYEENELEGKTLDDILAELGARRETKSPLVNSAAESGEGEEEPDFAVGYKPMASLGSDEAAAEFPDLSETDEQETKLDLAKAYFEMGDMKEASTILENVAKLGSESQKQEALSMLNMLAK